MRARACVCGCAWATVHMAEPKEKGSRTNPDTGIPFHSHAFDLASIDRPKPRGGNFPLSHKILLPPSKKGREGRERRRGGFASRTFRRQTTGQPDEEECTGSGREAKRSMQTTEFFRPHRPLTDFSCVSIQTQGRLLRFDPPSLPEYASAAADISKFGSRILNPHGPPLPPAECVEKTPSCHMDSRGHFPVYSRIRLDFPFLLIDLSFPTA